MATVVLQEQALLCARPSPGVDLIPNTARRWPDNCRFEIDDVRFVPFPLQQYSNMRPIDSF